MPNLNNNFKNLSSLDIIAFLKRCNVTRFEVLEDGFILVKDNNFSRFTLIEEVEDYEKKTSS